LTSLPCRLLVVPSSLRRALLLTVPSPAGGQRAFGPGRLHNLLRGPAIIVLIACHFPRRPPGARARFAWSASCSWSAALCEPRRLAARCTASCQPALRCVRRAPPLPACANFSPLAPTALCLSSSRCARSRSPQRLCHLACHQLGLVPLLLPPRRAAPRCRSPARTAATSASVWTSRLTNTPRSANLDWIVAPCRSNRPA